ncbi:unnamed protein product [Symbiodinium sp. CCMP2592]|nr:unnamed protein product [Symbiodinium sp. CCMP2592]
MWPTRPPRETEYPSTSWMTKSTTNSSTTRHSSMISPGATRVSSGLWFGFRRMPCHAKEPLGQTTAGGFGAGGRRRTPYLQALICEGELGEL